MGLTPRLIDELWQKERRTIPAPSVIFSQSVQALNLDGRSPAHVEGHFGEILDSLMDKGWDLLKPHRARAMSRYLVACWQRTGGYENRARELIQGAMNAGKRPHEQILALVSEVIGDLPPEVFDIMGTSLTNVNRKRAGVHMESSMDYLFRRCGLQFERQKPKRSDFVFPDVRTYKTRQERSVIVSAKHTIAERWKQLEADMRATGRNHFLATLDLGITPQLSDTIREHGITLYLLPEQQKRLSSKPNVRSLNRLVRDIKDIVPKEQSTL